MITHPLPDETPMDREPLNRSTLSGMTSGEAKEFNRLFVMSFLLFTGIAIVAHILAWLWRPWGGSGATYKAAMLLDGAAVQMSLLLDGAGAAATHFLT